MGGSLLAAAYLLGKMPEQHRCVWTELPGRDASDRVEGSTLAFFSPLGGFGHDGSSAKAEAGGGAFSSFV